MYPLGDWASCPISRASSGFATFNVNFWPCSAWNATLQICVIAWIPTVTPHLVTLKALTMEVCRSGGRPGLAERRVAFETPMRILRRGNQRFPMIQNPSFDALNERKQFLQIDWFANELSRNGSFHARDD